MTEFFISLFCTLALAPVVGLIMRRAGTMDVPNARSSHSVPTPRGGGLACMGGIVIAVCTSSLLHHSVPWPPLCAAFALGILGFVDDRRRLPATPRLVAQVCIGALAMIGFGGVWWVVAGAIAAPLAVNVVNFMDGINGITGLNIGLWGIAAFGLGLTTKTQELVVVGAVTAGSSLGFLPWNAPNARLFLGDTGSYLLGALVGFGFLIGVHEGISSALLVAPMALYLADTITTLAKRFAHGERLFEAHRDHVYQRLVIDSGFSHVLVSGLVTLLATVIAVSWIPGDLFLGASVTTSIITGYLLLPRILAAPARQRFVESGNET
jgi:UDP-N-acetylmuramyl pentapeptide phosphotransferase/UDP-N-acetylglucosamine-1-phosphate transferase